MTSKSNLLYQHTLIEEVFNTTLCMQYGHTERCAFAYTKNKIHIYHTAPLYRSMEIFNEAGEPVKIGETGEIVVTSYFNKVMPLIRYKAGGLAEFEGYNGNSLILNRIDGRIELRCWHRRAEGHDNNPYYGPTLRCPRPYQKMTDRTERKRNRQYEDN